MTSQIIAIVASYAIAIVGTYVILKVISLFTQLRASDDEQEIGLDLTQHGEDAPWVGIGFGLERLLMVRDGAHNVSSRGKSLTYLDGVRLNI